MAVTTYLWLFLFSRPLQYLQQNDSTEHKARCRYQSRREQHRQSKNSDDTLLIADSEETLQKILTTVTVERENNGLQLNAKKTECMVISKQSDISCNILCKGGRIKQVGTIKYLRFTITPGAICDT